MADYQLEIHHIDVTGGDCTLVLIRELVKDENPIVFSMLVDTGGVGSGPKKLLKYLEYFKELKEIDLFIASHYHDDHIRGISYYNDKEKKDRSLKFGRVLDIGDNARFCYPPEVKTFDAKAKRMPGFVKRYNEFTRQYKEDAQRYFPQFLDSTMYQDEEKKKKLGPYEVPLMHGKNPTGYSLKIWCAKGVLANGTDVVGEQKDYTSCGIDANDLSIAFTIHDPKGVVYFSAGDLSGDPTLKEYRNVEGPLMKFMGEQGLTGIPVVKATHHGSDRNNHVKDKLEGKSTTNCAPGFFDMLQPEVVIVPCNQGRQVPGAEFINDRLRPYLAKDNSRKAYFLNIIFYKKNEAHASGLGMLRKSGGTNIVYLENYYTIEQTASIVVVHQAGKNFSAPFAKDCKELSSHDTYKVYRNTAELVPAKVYGGHGGSSRIYNTINAKKKNDIFVGFEQQADEIAQWVIRGFAETPAGKVEDYLASRFPTLLKSDECPYPKSKEKAEIKEFREALVNRMKTLFASMYRHTEVGWAFNFGGPFTEDDEETMHRLLVGNRHQWSFNVEVGEDKAPAVLLGSTDFSTPFDQETKEIEEMVTQAFQVMKSVTKKNSQPLKGDKMRKLIAGIKRHIEPRDKEEK
jgi:hypothetical protein